MTQDNTLRTARTLPFSPEDIYNAFASPELLAAWWGPGGYGGKPVLIVTFRARFVC